MTATNWSSSPAASVLLPGTVGAARWRGPCGITGSGVLRSQIRRLWGARYGIIWNIVASPRWYNFWAERFMIIIKNLFLSRNCIFNNNGQVRRIHGFSKNTTDKLVTDINRKHYLLLIIKMFSSGYIEIQMVKNNHPNHHRTSLAAICLWKHIRWVNNIPPPLSRVIYPRERERHQDINFKDDTLKKN